jgi:deoxyribodipyrimidine photo-lyase
MRQVPDTWLFEPWRMPPTMQAHLGVFVGHDRGNHAANALVEPVVDLGPATHEAKQLLHSRRQTDEVKAAKKAVVDKHASRKNWGTSSRRTPPRKATGASADHAQAAKAQLGFDF